jgi:hypothetical protein
LTVVGDAKKMKDAKVMIRKFLDRLSFALRGPDSNEVFKASVQLYSLKGKK